MNKISKILIWSSIITVGTAILLIDKPITLDKKLRGMSQIEKSNIKSEEISKITFDKYTDSKTGIEVEILNGKVLKIDGGIELYARAFKGSKPLGLGSDGKTEWERFRIFDPPIMVDDPNGTTVRTWIDEKGYSKQRKLREDPTASIKSYLAHIIKVSSKEEKINEGSFGNTTDSFRPSAGTNSPADGMARRAAAAQQDFLTRRSSAGDLADASGAENLMIQLDAGTNTDNWQGFSRAIFMFDTSAIGTDDISSAILSIFGGTGKTDAATEINQNADVYTCTPGSDSDVVASDFNIANWGSTSMTGSPITYTNWNTGTVTSNDFTFDSTGKSNINKTGISHFGIRNANYDVAGVAPTWTDSSSHTLRAYYSDQAGTDADPTLVVVHSASGGGGSFPRILNNE